jgi:glyoxylase-like metal-dependent hydrolase (beta-lactamase superfamily II)
MPAPVLTHVAEHIWQVRIPLPYALNHVYCYLLRDADGWSVLDCGLHWPAALAAWAEALHALGIRETHIRRIVLTHMHPDHFGLAGWLQQRSGAPVWMTDCDRDAARRTWTYRQGRQQRMAQFLQACGVPQPALDAIVLAGEATAAMTDPSPEHIEALTPGECLHMGGRDWEIIATPGHSDGHAILFDRRDGLALSGDHVLMQITPNIGRWPDAEPAPLARYLDSLQSLQHLPVTRALPGHRAPIDDWGGRIAELQAHHAHRLALMQAQAAPGATVYAVAQHVFSFAGFTPHEIRFAIAETLAHLEHAQAAGGLRCDDREGVWWFHDGGPAR